MVIYDTKIPGCVMMEIVFSSHVCVGRVYSWTTKSTNFKTLKRLGYVAGRIFFPVIFREYFISHEKRIPINQPRFHGMSQQGF